MGRCIVYTRIRLLLLICPFGSLLFFLSNFQTIKIFVSLFSGTERPRRLKLGTHMNSGWMYCIYQKVPGCYWLFVPLFLHFSFKFSSIKDFRHTFLRNCEAYKVETWYTHEQWMYCVYWNQAVASYSSLYFFIFLSLQFSNNKIFRHIFLRNCEA